MMKTELRRHMGIFYMLLAVFFLFDPMIGFVDVLPDAIGYILLCVGLLRLSDLNGELAEAATRFRVMVWVGLGQIVASYILFSVMNKSAAEMNRYEQPVAILLCTFVLMVMRWYFLIPAFRALFKGLGQLADKHGCAALCAEKQGKTFSERLSAQTTFWIVLSSILSLLPELLILTSFEHDAESTVFTFDWYRFIDLFRGICGILLAIFAVIWLVRILRYASAMLRDGAFLESLRARYIEEILPQTGMLTIRRFSLSFLLISVGAVFTVSLRLNHYAILPALGFAVLILLAITHLGSLASESTFCKRACIALAIVSAVHILLNVSYLARFLPEASLYQADAYWLFFAWRVAGVCEALVTVIAVATLMHTLWGIVREHTAVDYGKDAKLLSASATDRLHRNMEKRLKIIFVIFLLASIANAADAVLFLSVPWIWTVALVLSVAGIFLLSSFLHDLLDLIRENYQATNK